MSKLDRYINELESAYQRGYAEGLEPASSRILTGGGIYDPHGYRCFKAGYHDGYAKRLQVLQALKRTEITDDEAVAAVLRTNPPPPPGYGVVENGKRPK